MGYGLGTLALGYAVYAANAIGDTVLDKTFNVLLCTAGGVFGWIAGMLITPSKEEKEDFSRVGGALMTFITGYVLAKFDPVINTSLAQPTALPVVLTRSLLFGISFGVGAVFVFVGRRYWPSDV
jgi:hypothetical protein